MKTFNTAGTCRPNEHYMVDLTERLEIIRKMVARGDYFCINRGRQYGKTTTLKAISSNLCDTYCIFNISFETIEDSCYKDEESLYAKFIALLARSFAWTSIPGLDDEVREKIQSAAKEYPGRCPSDGLTFLISDICHTNSKPVLLLVDEVDQAGNHPSFIKFLGLLREMYLNRDVAPTFQSVILASVYDIKNLKLKMRSDGDHQYNSPWNIAAPFDVDMSLSADGIAGMLGEYKKDHGLAFSEQEMARVIHDYTSGYPFLVSRICQIIDTTPLSWDKEGLLKAVNILLMERNTLFDNMIKQLDDNRELKDMLKRILFGGVREMYNPDDKYIQIATMFNYIINKDGLVTVACRVMETRLYNYFLTEERTSKVFKQGQVDKSQFVQDGVINMSYLLERFVIHMNQTFSMNKDHAFLEENGRRIFLTYLRPIINGIGSYHIEEQTRDMDRLDVVVDYLGRQYVVEIKIWRGNSYNERGEEQLCRYLEYFDLEVGYLLSFCFNKRKKSGLLPPVKLNGRTLVEAIV